MSRRQTTLGLVACPERRTQGARIVRLPRAKNTRHFLSLSAALLILSLSGCLSISPGPSSAAGSAADLSILPAEALREIAREIETQVMQGNREPVLQDREGIVIDVPEIRQAVRTRAARVELVSQFLDNGHSWERRNGRLWIIRSEAYKASGTSRTRDIDALMVNSENRDRWTLYETIIDQSRLPSKALSAVEEIFFEARLDVMKPGQKYEDANGDVAVKD